MESTARTAAPRAFAALLVLATATGFAPATPAHAVATQTALTVHGIGAGPKVCVDCEAPGPLSIMICNSASVTVTVGGAGIGSFGTGQSTSACITAPAVAPDTCVWLEYHYSCTRSGFFGAWQCTPTGVNTKFGDNPYC